MLLSLYKMTTRVATPLIEAHLQKRALLGKEDPARAEERRGAPKRARDLGMLIWFHAASVGESLSLLSVIGRVRAARPDAKVMVTTGTVTSAKLMTTRLPDGAFHQYMPVDQPDWVNSFLDHWRPDLAIWAEAEFWPNMLTSVKRRGIPAILLNARMSDKSFRHWRLARGAIAEVLSVFSLCLAQSEEEARRFRALRARDVRVFPNLKYASSPLPVDANRLEELKEAVAGRPLALFASTHPGEEEIAARLHAALKKETPRLLTIIVPRHPARAGEISKLLSGLSLKTSMRSANQLPAADDDIYIADTLGELGLFYRLCPFAIIGGSFAAIGGHNPIEPGQLGCAILYGPHTHNFNAICADFESRGAALRLKDETDLTRSVAAFLSDPARVATMAQVARAWTESQARGADEIAGALLPWLEGGKA